MKWRAIVLATVAASIVADAQVRDTLPAGAGTASISGVVVDDEERPVRRALVKLGSSGAPLQTVVTDSDGAFTFSDLAAGEYPLTASKNGYVTAQFGATRPGRTGTPVVLEPGERMDLARLVLGRGAVITGRIVDARGDPIGLTQVFAMRAQPGPRERIFRLPGNDVRASVQTDDRGIYRLFGLPPGSYVILAFPGRLEAEAQLLTRADIDATLATSQSSLPGQRSAPPGDATISRGAILTPIYFPGTPLLANATRIAIGVGEERRAIDFVLDRVPALRVQGTVAGPGGQPPPAVRVALLPDWASDAPSGGPRTSAAGPDGSFSFDGVAQGSYRLVAVAVDSASGAPSNAIDGFVGEPMPNLTTASTSRQNRPASASIALDLRSDVSSLSVVLRPSAELTVKFAAEDGGIAEADFSAFRVSLLAVSYADQRAFELPVDSKGVARSRVVEPGRYRLVVRGPADPGASLQLLMPHSVVVGDRDVIDDEFEITGNPALVEATIRVTNRGAALSGALQSFAGRISASPTLLLFSTDRSRWRWNSRWIRMARPRSDGQYSFPGMPPGDYYLAAVSDVDENEWFDPAFLQPLADQALTVHLADGERRIQNFAIPRSSP